MIWGIQLIIITMLIIIIVNLILQGSILPFFNFLIFFPNPALVSVVSIGLFKGKYYGAFFGLFMGLFQDILFGDLIGAYAFIYFLIGYASGMLNHLLNNENTITHIIFTALGTVMYNLMFIIIMYFLSKNISLAGAMKRIFSIEILYNCILAFIFYRIFHKVFGVHSSMYGKMRR